MKKAKWILLGILLFVGLGVGNFVCSWTGEAMQVVKEEISPKRLLEKYEWFKDTYATLGARKASISLSQKKISQMEEDYEGVARKDWDRVDKQQQSQWKTELDGLMMAYNNLASEYNSQMSKGNYYFTNIGELPQGATQVMPRSVAEYIY